MAKFSRAPRRASGAVLSRFRGWFGRALRRCGVPRLAAVALAVAPLASCGGHGPGKAAAQAAPAVAAAGPAAAPQIPPVELGKQQPGEPMTSANMPFFDTVSYCEVTTRKIDTMPRGPAYENCAGNQAHYRSIIGAAIDARQFKDDKVVECAKSSRTAYEGMWYCLNDQPYS